MALHAAQSFAARCEMPLIGFSFVPCEQREDVEQARGIREILFISADPLALRQNKSKWNITRAPKIEVNFQASREEDA
jgi:hypothetical protein